MSILSSSCLFHIILNPSVFFQIYPLHKHTQKCTLSQMNFSIFIIFINIYNTWRKKKLSHYVNYLIYEIYNDRTNDKFMWTVIFLIFLMIIELSLSCNIERKNSTKISLSLGWELYKYTMIWFTFKLESGERKWNKKTKKVK